MRRLEALRDDPLAVYDAIVTPKEEPRRSRLRNLRHRVASPYEGGLDYNEVREAEGLRARLVEALNGLLSQLETNQLDAEELEDSDA